MGNETIYWDGLGAFQNAVSKRPAAGQGLQITKWPAVELFLINLENYEFLSVKTNLYLLRITTRHSISQKYMIYITMNDEIKLT